MKPFCINRNSWHYKLNKKTNPQGDNPHYMERWEASNSNFCAYWRTTTLKLIWVGMIFFGVGFILFMIGATFYVHPIESLKVTVAIVGVIAFFLGLFFVIAGISTVNEKIAASDSLFIQKYRAHKSKICPVVEFK